MSNFCSECGAALVGSKRFCAECGTPTSGVESSGREVPGLTTRDADRAASTAVDGGGLSRELDSDEGAEPSGEDDDSFSPLAAAALAHAFANGGDMEGFWAKAAQFKAWQAEPRGPSLKTEVPSDFVFTGRDNRQAAAFEQLLARTGIVMGPSGLDAAHDRSQWDYYNGFWDIDSDDAIPIDVYFGRRNATGADALFVRSPLLLVPNTGGLGNKSVGLAEAATAMWDDIFNLAENPPPGPTLAPFGEIGPGYFGRFDREDHPIRGLLASETNLVRFNHRGRRGIATTFNLWRCIEVWYLIDASPPAADGIFSQVADIITDAQSILRASAYASDDGLVGGGFVPVAMGGGAEELLRAGFFTEIQWA